MPAATGHDEDDAERGRSDSADRLAARLKTAGTAYLRAALDNPAFGPAQAVFLLRNHRAEREVLDRIGADPRLTGHREVCLGLASHPGCSRPEAVRMLGLLGWRDLVRAVENPRTPAVVKRQALRLLTERLEGLSLGERITLARIAPRDIIPLLLREPHARALSALLANPRLTEQDVLTLARRRAGNSIAPSLIARSERWAVSRAVRWAIVENPCTPTADALHCVRRMTPDERRQVAEHPGVSRLVRVGAERSLRSSPRRNPGRDSV